MTLRVYLATHPGEYVLAESHVPLRPESFPDDLLEEEVEVYRHGQDAAGRSRFHLYVAGHHIATCLAEPGAEHRSAGQR